MDAQIAIPHYILVGLGWSGVEGVEENKTQCNMLWSSGMENMGSGEEWSESGSGRRSNFLIPSFFIVLVASSLFLSLAVFPLD